MRFSDSADIECLRVWSFISKMAHAQAIFESANESNCVILGMAAADRELSSVTSIHEILANAQAGLIISMPLNSVRLRRAAAAIAVRSGWFTKAQLAHDHTILLIFETSNCC